MTLENDRNAYILAHYYNLTPYVPGFYEPYHVSSTVYWNVLAEQKANTGILIKFNPQELEPPP